MKVLIILLSVVSLISAQVKIRCNEGKGECMIPSDCKTNKEVDERSLINGTCLSSQICCIPTSCGTRGKTTNEINTGLAEISEFPWQVAVLKSSKYIGGGSLIHKSFVLTIASKVIGENAADLMVRGGELDFSSRSGTHQQDINVEKIIMHEEFIRENGNPNNIALLQLKTPVTLDQHINTVCLPPPKAKYNNKRCIVTGWGKSQFSDNDEDLPKAMKKIEMSVISTQMCELVLKNERPLNFGLPEGTICAGEGEEDTCVRNGGSPLVSKGDDGLYYQVGIVSWGLGCKKDGVPAVYTEVSHYIDWINKKTSVY